MSLRYLALALFVCACVLTAQVSDGNIVGTVLDASGAAVPNANVELLNTATAVRTVSKTDTDGSYRFGNVLVGDYNILVTASGFTGRTLKNVRVELNKTTTANITLEVGTVSSTVEVTAASALIDTTTAQVANTYESRLAADLPLAANPLGGVLNLSLLGAGVASSGGIGVGTGPSVGGQRPRNNNYMVEGVDNNRKDVTGPLVAVPNDAVAEFTVLQNQVSAEFGHSSGGQFNSVLKSGTNELHGTVYEYLLNRNLNALDQSFKRQGIFSQPRYDQNRLGGDLGGHIIKNKLFYYGLYEYNPLGQASTPAGATYSPTAAGYAALDGIPNLSKTNLGVLKQYLTPAPVASNTTTVQGVSIPIGILPIVAPQYTNAYSWLVSIDYNLSDRDQIRGRYVDNKQSGFSAVTASNLPVFFYPRPITSHLLSLSEFHTFRPNVTNEFRLAYNRYNDNIGIPNFQFPGLDIFPNIQIQNDLNVQIGPYTSAPQATIQNTYQIVETLGWSKGRHDLKFGFDGRDLIAASTFIQRVRGDYDYSTLERYLLDYVPDVLAQRNIGGKPYSGNQFATYGFVNDNFRVNRNFTLNLGMRYEFTSVPKSMKEFQLNSLADVPGVLTFFEPKPQKTNFAPRIGFAYSPGESGKTSIRGGFGIMYDQIFDNVGTNARPPQATSTFDQPVVDQCCFLGNGGIKPTAPTTQLTPAQARAATSSWLPDQKIGYSTVWNLGIQRVFAKDYTFEARYVGTKGIHLIFQDQLNRAAVVTPTHNLPTLLAAPSQAYLDSLTISTATLATERNTPGIGNTMAQYGFTSNITAYVPRGNSIYHGLAMELTRRFSKDLHFRAAYTWSHLMDDSTSEVNSTTLSPRRPQDFNNIRSEWASSALDRRQRVTLSWLYETPWYRNSGNKMLRYVLGGYEISGAYTAESPEYITPQSAVDSNQNGDAAGDRVIINPAGVPGTSSDVTALKNSSGATVAYLANNPNAQYIRAQIGAFATSGRNILASRGINNFDFSVFKNLRFGERWKLGLRADFLNGFNHPQYTPGRINNVNNISRANVTNYLTPGNPLFAQFDQVYSSNPRTIQVGARLTF